MKEYLKAFLDLAQYNRRTGSTSKLLSGFKDSEFYFISGNEVSGLKNIKRLAEKHPELGIDKDKVKVISITGNIRRANFHTCGAPLPIAVDVFAVKTIVEMALLEIEKKDAQIWALEGCVRTHGIQLGKLKVALAKSLPHNKEWADWSTSGGREWYTETDVFKAAIQVIERKEFYRYRRLNQQLKALRHGRITTFDYKLVKMAQDRAYRKFIKP